MPDDATAVQERDIRLEPVRLSVLEAGEGGLPLLLLHGFTGAKEDFADFVGPLAADGGTSSPPTTGATAPATRHPTRPTTPSTSSWPTCWPCSTSSGGTAACCWATRWAG